MLTDLDMDLPSGSSRLEMYARWRALSRDIANCAGQIPENSVKGRLTVIGSGLCHIDILNDAKDEIKKADKVFHCTNDRVTQAWLGSVRPDGFDLRMLYDERMPRRWTYIRMAEGLLHYVRQGLSVTALFYGHPGIFATPAHRAIKIARAEGHEANMRPGISALDYLVADLGFDPALPGLLSYEATDMLLYRRPLDPSLHVVLWQVGVVGEFGFSHSGFSNHGFDVLLDALIDNYHQDWPVYHYIAPQYVGIEPLIERHTMASLRDVSKRSNISAISTFYIPPMNAITLDKHMAIRLGLMQEEDLSPKPIKDFVNVEYGPDEIAALRSFNTLELPPYYFMEQMSPAAEFMLAVSNDPELRKVYRISAERVLADPRFQNLTPRARKLLMIPHPTAINAALAEPAAMPNELQTESTPRGMLDRSDSDIDEKSASNTSSFDTDKGIVESSALEEESYLFICGVHRSGTSALSKAIQLHPDTSGFVGTGVEENEGQFLQDVLKTDTYFGGPGKFAFHDEARLTEHNFPSFAQRVPRIKRFWNWFWNKSTGIRVEKSPMNIVRSRFLQACFPKSHFLFLIRHPLFVAAATSKWTEASTLDLVRHWIAAHRIATEDMPFLSKSILVRYEDLVSDPHRTMVDVFRFIGISDIISKDLDLSDHNQRYMDAIVNTDIDELTDSEISFIESFGYSLHYPFIIQ